MKIKLLIFGITGDLSTRKLLPAITRIVQTDDFKDIEIIGVSRREVDMSAVSTDVTNLTERTRVFSMDLANASDYLRLKDYIALKDDEQLLVYLSVPPSAATQIVDFLGEASLNDANVKLLFEKPFGVDLVSATEVIERSARYFSESQIYRIDHYLAKEMAQNIAAFRAGNALFSQTWSGKFIESIEIVAFEKIGIEGRAQFYEQTGALRDFVQGHLMQLLAIVLMDIPTGLDWNSLPEKRLKALKALNSANPEDAFRAQYQGYQDEVKNPGSPTETFASVVLSSSDSRWSNVRLRLATGKAMQDKKTEIRIHYRKSHEAQSNCLIFKIQPNEGIEVDLFTKKPGYDKEFETQKLQYSYGIDSVLPDAYEQVLVDAIRSNKSLFTSSKEVLESWRILAQVQYAWSMDNSKLALYRQGSSIDAVICD